MSEESWDLPELTKSIPTDDLVYDPFQSEKKRSRHLVTLDVKGLLSSPPKPVPWVAEPLCARHNVTLLAGREGEGKSMIAMAIAKAIQDGTRIGDLSCTMGETLYIDAENGEMTIQQRLHLLGLQADGIAFQDSDGFSLSRHFNELEDAMTVSQPDLVVLDSLRSLWPDGDENDSAGVERLFSRLRRLAIKYNCAVLVLHHLAKDNRSTYRGTTALGAGCQIACTLRKDKHDASARIIEWHKCRVRSEPEPMWLRFFDEGARLRIDNYAGSWQDFRWND